MKVSQRGMKTLGKNGEPFYRKGAGPLTGFPKKKA